MSQLTNRMFKWLFVVFLLGTTAIGGGYLIKPTHPVVIKSSAQAWVWVVPHRQEYFVTELCAFAKQRGFKCNPSKPPSAGWQMIGIIIVTPKDNEISVINATAPDKFAADITLLHPEPEWRNYWRDFRAYVSARHRWEDIP